jgi:hypothetical protein
MYFKDEKYKQSLDLVIDKIEVFELEEGNVNESFELERSQIYQLIYYCQAKINAQAESIRWCSHLETKLVYFKNHSNFEEVLWIIVESVMNNLT